MEAKDTVLYYGTMETQAEMSFKAGIREVAEWIHKNSKWEQEHYTGRSIGSASDTGICGSGILPLTETYYLISKDKLQAKYGK